VLHYESGNRFRPDNRSGRVTVQAFIWPEELEIDFYVALCYIKKMVTVRAW